MKALSKLILRRPLFFTALTLMLAVAAAFSAVGVSAYSATSEQLAEVNAAYTTVAIPYNKEFGAFMPQSGEGDYHREILEGETLDDLLAKCPYVLGQDKRAVLAAVPEGMKSLHVMDYMTAYIWSLYAYADNIICQSVFAVHCDSVEINEYTDSEIPTIFRRGPEDEWTGRFFCCNFSLIEPISTLERDYGIHHKFLMETMLTEADGSSPFEAGKDYLICFSYHPDPFIQRNIDEDVWFINFSNGMANPYNGMTVLEDEDGVRYMVRNDNAPPLYAEYEGDVHDFLESEDGKVWRDEIIPACEASQHAAKLMLTDNINSVYQFNTGAATLVDGRLFTKDEYDSGAKVCLISQLYADFNDLRVGDKLNMDIYAPDTKNNLGNHNSIRFYADTYIEMNTLYSDCMLESEQEYEIVGIYTAPSTPLGSYALGPNMFFAPKSSVPEVRSLDEAKDWQYRKMPILNSVILKYGTTEQFEQYMSDNGWGECFVYSDQGYSEVGEALQAAMTSAERLLIVSLAVFVIVLCVYIFLIANRIKPSVRTMRIVGVSRAKCFGQSMLAMLPLLLIAVAVGAVLGGLLFDMVSGAVVSDLIHFSPAVAVFCAAAQFALLALCEVVCFAVLSRKNLMNRK